jgi:hypothetical protein
VPRFREGFAELEDFGGCGFWACRVNGLIVFPRPDRPPVHQAKLGDAVIHRLRFIAVSAK